MAVSCHCSAQRPLLSLSSPVNAKFPFWRRVNCANPVSRSSRRLQPSVLGWKSANKKWRLVHVACFKHVEGGGEEESSCSVNYFKLVEKQNEGSSNAESEQQVKDGNINWISKIQKVLDKFFRSHGEPWRVPWTAETIIQFDAECSNEGENDSMVVMDGPPSHDDIAD